MRARWTCVVVLAGVGGLRAQNAPHLAYALPAGGQQGTTVEVTLGGQYLVNASAVSISGGGVEVKLGEHGRPMNGAEQQQLRNRMQDLQKEQMTEAVRAEMIDIRVKLLKWNAERFTSPTLAERRKVRVTIAPGAALGNRELRVTSPQGLSNPVIFRVGELPEFSETETIEAIPPAAGQPPNQTQITQRATDMPVTIPATINGRIKPRLGTQQQQNRAVQPFTPGDADRYRFQARKGQQLVVVAAARDLNPYLADAVPGWFQAVLTLYDGQGREVAYCDDYRFHPDPVIHYAVPEDGEYAVEIRDAIYRGREDFVYRISLGELPFLTNIFPLGGKAGSKTKVALDGWNLPVRSLTLNNKGKTPGLYPVAVNPLAAASQLASNSLPFQVDELTEVIAKPGNDSPAHAQKVKLPVVVNGRVEQPGQWSVYRFEGRAGKAIVAEVYARRIESPLDSVLRLTDAKGTQIAFNDDFDDKGEGLETHHADSRILTTLPASGTYFLYLGDMQSKAGPEYAYRLRISEPRPDFELRVMPSGLNLVAGMATAVTAHAVRRDGFAGDIRIALKGAPEGITLAGATIRAGQDDVRFTIAAPRQPRPPFELQFEGTASIGGREVKREAVPADSRMQAFFYWHVIPAQEAEATVRRGTGMLPFTIEGPGVVRLAAGESAAVRVKAPPAATQVFAKVSYELNDPPEGVTLAGMQSNGNSAELDVRCDGMKAKPGLRGNLIVTITGERAVPAQNGRPANRQRVALGVLPAIPFEIVAPPTAPAPSMRD